MQSQSILTSIKKMLGIEEEYEQFDLDITIHINTAFAVLHQMGVGPSEGFRITDKDQTWEDFMSLSASSLDLVKNYIYMKVKLVFDPPLSSANIETYNKLISEYEWRMYTAAEFNQNGLGGDANEQQ